MASAGNASLHLFAAAGTALLLTFLGGALLLPRLRRWRVGQTVRRDGPRTHLAKTGTPTMGGLLFLPVVPAVALFFGRPDPELFLPLLAFVGFGLVGFADDYVKVILRRPLGLRARYKLLGQVGVSVLVLLLAQGVGGRGSAVLLPFSTVSRELGLLYPLLAISVFLGTSNAVNLTDGLDGLLAGATILVGGAYTLVCLAVGATEAAVVAAALAGAAAGFLIYNRHPARVFMGDTGSLAIGGGLAALAVVTRTELILPLIGGLFVVEALSVIVQVAAFQWTGRRLLRMSPLHHHFELGGWSEWTVVTRLWMVTLLFAAAGLIATRGTGG